MQTEPHMERMKLLVIATVIGALGLFGLRLWSSSVDDAADLDEADGTRVARQADDAAIDGAANMPRLGRNRGGGSRSAEGAGGWTGSGGRGGADSHSRRSGADVLAGGRGAGGGTVGTSGSAARGKAGGFGGTVARLDGSVRDSGGRDSSRADLLDTLAAQPKSRATGQFAAAEPQELEPDVLLAVNKPEDTADAVESENVETSEGGHGISFKDG